jgi:HD-like signal output (HDOD) protein
MDHCETGLQLIKGWKLPLEFEDVIARHHRPHEAGAEWNLATLIQKSCRLADTSGFPAFAHCLCASYEELLAELPEEIRSLLDPDAKTFSAGIAEAIHQIELV